MEKFGLLQLLSTFAKNMQNDGQKNNEQSILDVFMDNMPQNTPTNPPAPPYPDTSMQNSNTIFTTEIRQRQFTNILLRHEEISKRIDKRNKH